MKKSFLLAIFCFFAFSLCAQKNFKSFEIRHFTNDAKANGETDFKGETGWMDTRQRIRFLEDYADFASRYFDNPEFDDKIVTRQEVANVLNGLKPQPLTKVRQTLPLNIWMAYGYREGQDGEKSRALQVWRDSPGASIEKETLLLENGSVVKNFGPMTWRFAVSAVLKTAPGGSCRLVLSGKNGKAIDITLKDEVLEVISQDRILQTPADGKDGVFVEVEGDFTGKSFNLTVDGNLVHDYIPMADPSAMPVTEMLLQSTGKVWVDDLFIFNHIPEEDVRRPFRSEVVLDEDFKETPPVEGWQRAGFDDSHWQEVELPAVHGGVREKGEDYFLRKKIFVGEFERATLVVETLDPAGEIWVNNQVVAVVNSRHPVEVDLTGILVPKSENILAVRVKPNLITSPDGHAPSDRHVGWFLGRTHLLLTHRCMIKNALIFTASLGDTAVQRHKIRIQFPGKEYVGGSVEISYNPWFPRDGEKAASVRTRVELRPSIVNEMEIDVPVPHPEMWDDESPVLYRVEVLLRDKAGNPVDDYVTTTGIRKVEQKDGKFYLNGKPGMLNGAQIMGFRVPMETIAKYHRCPPPETVAEELLMIKKMGANLLRMHVHAQSDTTEGVNDPRYAEMADQLGICLMWQTAGWIRDGEAWNIDFEGYPLYMGQVFNHPSIVMWEASNHPNRFKQHDISDSHDFVGRIVRTIAAADPNRLITPTTFWQHLHYADYNGTRDHKGNSIDAVPEYRSPLVTRGSQDAYAGYGHEWSAIRKAPNSFAASCLAANEKAYFNFEHEESIGQPNWNLCKGKPWYLLQSYEWEYDEGSIGRKLTTGEWKASQAWQAFSAWESMKKQMLLGYDGFSWCCLHGGANMGTYKKPLIDNLGHPKLAYYVNKMIFQKNWAGSDDVDVVMGPGDRVKPVIHHLGEAVHADLAVRLVSLKGKVLEEKWFRDVYLQGGPSITRLENFRFRQTPKGTYIIDYEVIVH